MLTKRYFMTAVAFFSFFGSCDQGFSQVNAIKDSTTDQMTLSRTVDSLKKVMVGTSGKPYILALIDVGWSIPNFDSAIFYFDKAIRYAESDNDSVNIIIAWNAKGFRLKENGNLKESIVPFEHALSVARRTNNTYWSKIILNNLGMVHTSTGYYSAALKYFFESLKMRELTGNATDISVVLNNIGWIYEELGDYERALTYYEKCYQVKIKNKVTRDLPLTMSNIVLTLIALDRLDEAKAKIEQVFTICDSIKCSPYNWEQAHTAHGWLLLKQKKYSAAHTSFSKALELSQHSSAWRSNSPESIIENLYWLASVKYETGKWEQAIDYLDRSHVMALKENYKKQMRDNYLLYSKIYSSTGNYREAFEFLELYNRLNAELMNGALINKIALLQTEIEERENTDKLVSQAKIIDLQQNANDRQRLLNVLTGAIAFLLLCMTIMLVRTNRQRRQINELLDERVVERTLELEKQRDELRQAHNEQSVLLKKLAADLFSSAATLKGLSTIAKEDLPIEQAAYFREAEVMAEKLVSFVNGYPSKQLK